MRLLGPVTSGCGSDLCPHKPERVLEWSSIHQSRCCRQCLSQSFAMLRSYLWSCTEGNCRFVCRGAEAGTQPRPGRRDLVVMRACAGMHAEMLIVACCADLHDEHQLRRRGLRRALHAGLVWAQRMPACRPLKTLSCKVTTQSLCCKEPPDKCSIASPLRGTIPRLESATCSQPVMQVRTTPLHPSCMVLQVRWKASPHDPLQVQRGSMGPLSAQVGSTLTVLAPAEGAVVLWGQRLAVQHRVPAAVGGSLGAADAQPAFQVGLGLVAYLFRETV